MLERFGLSCTVLQQTVSFVSHRIRRARHLEGGTTDAGEGVVSRQTRSRNTNEGLIKYMKVLLPSRVDYVPCLVSSYLRTFVRRYIPCLLGTVRRYLRTNEGTFVPSNEGTFVPTKVVNLCSLLLD